jgi:hypothetical protein
MKGDFSRVTFDVTKHFSRVLMQQGRVQLDADWNEQTAILLHYLQSLTKDLIGEHGGPLNNLAFEIAAIDANNFSISNGHYYVDGILVELGGTPIPIEIEVGGNGKTIKKIKVPELTINNMALKKGQYLEVFAETDLIKTLVKITSIDSKKLELTVELGFVNSSVAPLKAQLATTYSTQDDYPLPDEEKLKNDNTYLVYLDLWERHITYIEDDNIREVALGGPDTATRAKVVWQVKITNKTPDNKDELKNVKLDKPKNWHNWVYANNRWSTWKNQWQPANRGMLKAMAKQDQKKDTDPCLTSPESSYRGAENQLYRVEIHKGGKLNDKPTFKWSRDNGSVVTGIKLNGTELTVDNPRGFTAKQWVELTNDGQELRGEVGTLVKIKKIDSDILSLDVSNTPTPIANLPTGEGWPTKARLWESDEIPIIESKDWFTLADGVQIQFQPSAPAHQYRTGDYWLIPARVATGDVEWPGTEGNPEALPPHGIEHHYAPLAIINTVGNNITLVQDLRRQIEPQGKPIP